jgi:hypothetical protein
MERNVQIGVVGGGTLYSDVKIDGCLKLVLKNFMEYYKLINPVTIIKNMKTLY